MRRTTSPPAAAEASFPQWMEAKATGLAWGTPHHRSWEPGITGDGCCGIAGQSVSMDHMGRGVVATGKKNVWGGRLAHPHLVPARQRRRKVADWIGGRR